MERKDYIILALGLALITAIVWLLNRSSTVTPVGGKPKVIMTETVRVDTIVKPAVTIIKKVPMVQTVTIDNTDTVKIRSLIAQVDSLEKSLLVMRVDKKLSLDTICGTDSDTVSMVINVYRKQLDSLSIRKKPVLVSKEIMYQYVERDNTDLWLAVGVGALGTALLFFILGGK